MKKLFTLLVLINLSFGFYAKAQDTLQAKLEDGVSSYKLKLNNPALKPEERENIYREIAYSINQLGEIHFANGNYEVATKSFVEADSYIRKVHESAFERKKIDLAVAETKYSKYQRDTSTQENKMLAKIFGTLVSIQLSEVITEARYFNDTEFEKKHLERLAVVAKAIGDVRDEAKAYEKLGELEIDNDNRKGAFEYYEKALPLRKSLNQEWWTLDYIAYAHWQIGEYSKAIEFFEKEIAILKELEKRPLIVSTEYPAGVNLSGEELAKSQKTRTLSASLEKANIRSSLAAALFNVAQIRMSQGNYGVASAAIKEVSNIIETFKAEQTKAEDETLSAQLILTIMSHEATLLRTQGRIMEAQGKDAEALKNYAEAVNLFSQLSGGQASGAVVSLRGRMAMLLSKQQKFEEARANIKDVLRVRQRLHQQSGTVYALILASRVERAAKETEAALKYARQAKAAAMQLNFADDVLAEANEAEADNLLDKATDKNSLSLEQAIVGYKTAIETYKKAGLSLLLARALNSLGSAYEKADKFKEAEATYKEAIKINESIGLSFSSSEESDAFQNKKETTEIFKRLVDLLVRQGKNEQALQYATKAQRRGLSDAIPKSEIKLTGKSATTLKTLAAAENKMVTATKNLEKSRVESGSKSQTNKLISTLGAARQDYALAIKRLEIEQPNLRFTVRPTDLLKLQASVAPNEAIISYLITNEKLYVFVVRKNAVAVRAVEISEDDLRVLVAQVRTGLDNFAEDFYSLSYEPETGFAEEKNRADLRSDEKTDYYKKNLAPVKTALTTLHEHLVSPVADLLTGTETIKFIPNGDLFLLPFAALISPEKNQYLIEKYNLVFLTAGDLISSPAKIGKGSLVAFGNPTEADLEGALQEVKAIQKVFPGSKIYTEAAATKNQLFKITSAKVLHLATHGHILSPLESSNIQLAHLPGNSEPDLTYGEIYALPIESIEMVVLSACKTALGTVSGTEIGVFIEAFRTKTNTVAASLWSVDDIATRELMTEFYKNLVAGKSRAAALRTAQLKLLKDGRTKNPLFWAAFVLYGEGGKLSGMQNTIASKAVK
jgi:CHAT domain-containing protein